MNNIYKKIWDMARPYYEQARPMDIEHIEWMMKEAKRVCDAEGLDPQILMPLVILHDVGYAKISSDNPFDKDERVAHMHEGAILSGELLNKVNFPPDKTRQVSHYVSIHDVWALGDHQSFKKDKLLGCFNDLDFIWMLTEKGFSYVSQYLKLSPNEMIEFIQSNEKLKNRPFSSKSTEALYHRLLAERLRFTGACPDK